MKILFDTSVILDILLDRQPFSEDAAELLGRVDGWVVESTFNWYGLVDGLMEAGPLKVKTTRRSGSLILIASASI